MRGLPTGSIDDAGPSLLSVSAIGGYPAANQALLLASGIIQREFRIDRLPCLHCVLFIPQWFDQGLHTYLSPIAANFYTNNHS